MKTSIYLFGYFYVGNVNSIHAINEWIIEKLTEHLQKDAKN